MSPAARVIDSGRGCVNVEGMDLDELLPAKPDDPLAQLARQDLDPLSADELRARIEALRAEIARAEAAVARRESDRSAAEALFRR